MQAGTTPKKRTSLNGRAALKLMRLDGARRAHQAASDARVTKAVSSIAVGLLLISSGTNATECQSSPGHDGKWWSYRIVELQAMLVSGQAGPLQGPVAVGEAIAAASRDPPGPRRQPAPCTASPAAAAHRDRQHYTEGGPNRVDPGADERGAADGRAPAVFARAAAIASQADEPSKWWMLLLIIPAIATGLAVVASQFHPARKERRQGTLFKNFKRRRTNWQAAWQANSI